MALSTLREFFSGASAESPQQRQALLARGFPEALGRTQLLVWHGPQDVPSRGSLLVVGVAIGWNHYDQLLVAAIDEAAQDGRVGEDSVAVFPTDELLDPSAIEALLPGLTDPLQTPYVGWWRDGAQILIDSGPSAMAFICDRYGLRVP